MKSKVTKLTDAIAAASPRRKFLTQSSLLTGAAIMGLVPPAIRQGAWAAGSDAPEKTEVKIGFISLTDCASVVIASVMKFDEKYGIKIIPSKEASWAAVRDKLVNGEIDAAHVLYGLIYGVQMGIGGPKKDMSVLLMTNNNRCQKHYRAATANGREHARGQYGWLLRRRAVECPRDFRQDRIQRGDDSGYLERSSGKGHWHNG